MKKLFLAMALLVAVATQAQDNTDFKNETIKFLKLSGATSAFDSAISQIGMNVPADKKEAYTKEANETLTELFSKMAGLYMKEFTPEDIKGLVTFYESDLGKKMASKQTILMQQAMQLGQYWGLEVQQIAQKFSK